MAKYKKKVVIVNAWEVTRENINYICTMLKNKGKNVWIDEDKIVIPTLEGIMYATYDDYVIQGVKGEIYPCKKDIFNMTYEKV